MPAATHTASRGRDGRFSAAVAFVVVAVCVVVGVFDLAGMGREARQMIITMLILATAVGPFVRGARPRLLWALIPVTVTLLWGAMILETAPPDDAGWFAVGGYVAFTAWILIVAFSVGRRTAFQTILDSITITIGVLIVAWTYAANVFGAALTTAVVWAVYPLFNVLLVGFTAPLAINLGRKVPAWRYLAVGLVWQLLIDVVAVLTISIASPESLRVLSSLEAFTFFFIAAAACHPSVAAMNRAAPEPRIMPPASLNRIFAVLAGIVLAVIVLFIPTTTPIEETIRTVLVIGLCTVVLVRLFSTMLALARAEEESRHRANHDELTGLPNRTSMFESLAAHMARGHQTDTATVMLFIDCDGFKQINDAWGHHMGDRLLRKVAEDLPQHLPERDFVARHGGDEFVVIANVGEPAETLARADAVLDYFAGTHQIEPGHDIEITCSIGIAVAGPGEALTPMDLLGRADVALYEAKSHGRERYELYDQKLHERTTERARLAEALRKAVAEERITVAFQPFMGGPGYGALLGWEALARWTEPGYGAVRPDVFIGIAEELGLIHDLGASVLRASCRALAKLRLWTGYADTIVSVNVSGYQLNRPSFPAVVLDALEQAGLDGTALWLEITETHLVEKGERVLATLTSLRELGVSVVLDDFGTGYSSMATLGRLPFDVVKLDRSLVADVDSSPAGSAQVRALSDLLASMGIRMIVAEGVETREQAVALEAIGCPIGQGWYFGYPTPPAEIVAAVAAEDTSDLASKVAAKLPLPLPLEVLTGPAHTPEDSGTEPRST